MSKSTVVFKSIFNREPYNAEELARYQRRVSECSHLGHNETIHILQCEFDTLLEMGKSIS